MWPRGLVEKHGSLSKLGPMLKFKRCLDLSSLVDCDSHYELGQRH